jgi:alanine-glyoxylate transaminase/serine-glyoxylate transaminase/serine-pyruvate transaminase
MYTDLPQQEVEMIKRPMLMIPGPIDLADDVRQHMGQPIVAHYGADWVPIYQETISLLQYAFNTPDWVVMIPGSGTTGLDAAVGSLLARGEKALVLTNGAFGDRLTAIAKSYQLDVHVLASSSLQPTPVDQVEQKLAEGGFQAVLMIHHETSSGVLNPVREVAALCRRFDAPFVLDAVSSLGIAELNTHEWGIDLCVSASQKGLEAPPGLALVAISERAWQIMREKAPLGHGFYLDLLTWRKFIENWGDWHPSVVTMPTGVILALRASLQKLQQEGLDRRIARYRHVARTVRTGLAAMSFELLVEDEWAATGITAVKPPADIDPGQIQAHLLQEHNIAIARGGGEWSDVALRIGHMGSGTQPDHLIPLLMGLEETLRSLGHPVERGSSLAGLPTLWAD